MPGIEFKQVPWICDVYPEGELPQTDLALHDELRGLEIYGPGPRYDDPAADTSSVFREDGERQARPFRAPRVILSRTAETERL